MKICIIGSGYVGLVSGACFAEIGNAVTCVDIDQDKIATLKSGNLHLYEPGLKPLVRRNLKNKRLKFTTNITEGITGAKIIFICVNTPPRPNGEADLCYVENVSRSVARAMSSYKVIVSKSTVPVRTGEKIREAVSRYIKKGVSFDVASNPEFLREGQAVRDFMHPDRIVVGVESVQAKKIFQALYKPFKCPKLFTNIKSAELIKHASNSFLACKISFINMISNICDETGGNIEEVAHGMGLDKRIGKSFLNAGIGFGGSCFPKDLKAFIKVAEEARIRADILKNIENINHEQVSHFLKKIRHVLWNVKGKTISVLGLSFKPETDDMRNAPSISIIKALVSEGAIVQAYDPHAMEKAKVILPDIDYCLDEYATLKGADALVILTEWKQFKNINLKKVKKLLRDPIIIDGRNIFDPKSMSKLGFQYISMGRSH